MTFWLALACAFLAALCFGIGSVLQAAAARHVAVRPKLDPMIFVALGHAGASHFSDVLLPLWLVLFPVLALAPHSLADIYSDIRLVGSVVDARDEAEDVIGFYIVGDGVARADLHAR